LLYAKAVSVDDAQDGTEVKLTFCVVRDEYENKREDLEKKLSDLLGETWKFEVNPNFIFAYANDGYAKNNFGGCIYRYNSPPCCPSIMLYADKPATTSLQ
jgi:hypothetical protein